MVFSLRHFKTESRLLFSYDEYGGEAGWLNQAIFSSDQPCHCYFHFSFLSQPSSERDHGVLIIHNTLGVNGG